MSIFLSETVTLNLLMLYLMWTVYVPLYACIRSHPPTHKKTWCHGRAEQPGKKQGTVLKASVTALYLTYESEETLCSLLKDGQCCLNTNAIF